MEILLQDQSPLLRLPAEILETILQDVLSEPGVNEYHTRVKWKRASWKQPQAVTDAATETEYSKSSRSTNNDKAYTWKAWGGGRPNLSVLLACRQLYAQARTHVFKDNWFVINGFISDRHKRPDECCFLGSLPLRDAFRTCPALGDIQNLSIKIQIDQHSRFYHMHTPEWRNVLFELPQTLCQQLRQLKRIRITTAVTQYRQSYLWVDERALLYRFGFLKANHVEFLGFKPGVLDSLEEVMKAQARPIDLIEYLLQLLDFVYEVSGAKSKGTHAGWGHLWLGVWNATANLELRQYFEEFVRRGDLERLLDYALGWAVESFYDVFDTFMEGMIPLAEAMKNSLVEMLPSKREVESATSWSQVDVMELWIDRLVSLDRKGRFLQLEFRQRVAHALGRSFMSQMDISSLEVLRSDHFQTLTPLIGRRWTLRNYVQNVPNICYSYQTFLKITRASH